VNRTERAEFTEFIMDEATKYGASMTPSEAALWCDTFRNVSLREFQHAWMERKSGAYGHLFPRIPDMQRSCKVVNENAVQRDDHCCVWTGEGRRCKYPVGFFAQGSREGYCFFHRHTMAGPDAQGICDRSQTSTPEEYLKAAKAAMYSGPLPSWQQEIRDRAARATAARKSGVPMPAFVAPRQREPGDDEAEAHIAAADAKHLDEINRMAAMAATEDA